jgi:hypothetical protein
MDYEKYLNDNKDKIVRFEVYDTSIHIHLVEGGQIEIDTNSPFVHLNINYVVNND